MFKSLAVFYWMNTVHIDYYTNNLYESIYLRQFMGFMITEIIYETVFIIYNIQKSFVGLLIKNIDFLAKRKYNLYNSFRKHVYLNVYKESCRKI